MTTSQTAPPAPRRRRRRWPWLVFGPPAFVLAVLAVLFLFLRTDFGLARLEILLNNNLQNIGGQDVALTGLHGSFPFDLRVRELRLRDDGGLWLTLDDFTLRWSGRDLLAARVRVFELSAAALELSRLPVTAKAEPEDREPFQGFDPPRALPRIAVDSLAVRKIVLGEDIAGQRTVLELDANLDAGDHGLLTDLRLEAVSGAAGLLSLHADFSPKSDRLQLHAGFSDPSGQLAPLLGLPRNTPLRLQLGGDGPPATWSGSLSAQAGNLVGLHSDLNLDWQDIPRLDWSGEITTAPSLLPSPADTYLAGVSFSVTLSQPEHGGMVLDRLALDNSHFQARLEGRITQDFSEVSARASLAVLNTTPLHRMIGVNPGPEIHLAADIAGPLDGPEIRARLKLRDVVAEQVTLAALDLEASACFDQQDQDRAVTVRGALVAQGLDLNGMDTLQALAEPITMHYDLHLERQRNALRINELTVQGRGLNLRADASYSLDDSGLNAKIALLPSPLRPWLATPHQDVRGLAGVQIAARGTVQPVNLALSVQAQLTALAGLPEPLPALLGESPRLTTVVELLTEDGGNSAGGPDLIKTSNLRLAARGLDLRADARFYPHDGQVQATARLKLPDLSKASPSTDLDMAGAAVLEVTAQGALEDSLALDAVLSSQDLSMAGLPAFPLRIAASVRDLLNAPGGSLFAEASPRETPLTFGLDFELKEKLLRWSSLELALPQGKITGQGQADLNSGLARADLRGDIADIAPLMRLAWPDGQDLHGALRFQAEVQPDNDALAANLNATLDGLESDFGQLESLTLHARAADLPEKPTLDALLALESLQAGENRVDNLTARLSGSLEELGVRTEARGHALHPFDLGLHANLTARPSGHELRLERLDGVYADQALALASPVTVSLEGENIALSPLMLHFGPAVVRAQAELSDEAADLRFGLEELPLEIFTEQAQGVITAGVVLNGPKTGLAGNLTLLGRNLTPRLSQLNAAPAFDVRAEAALNDQGVGLEAAIAKSGEASALLTASGRLPLRLALEPAGMDLPDGAPISGAASGEVDLDWLGDMVLPETQMISGLMRIDLRLAGTVRAPVPSGRVGIGEAVYQHLAQGVLLRDIAAEALLEDNAVVLRSLSATDGAEGRLNASGRVDLNQEQGFPFALTIQAADLNVLDSPLARARLADLDLAVSGTASDQEVRGHVDMDRVEVFLKDLGGPPVAELPVVVINGRQQPVAPRPEEEAPAVSPLGLDVIVRFPAKVFVRGRGLDSEWGGNLKITGAASTPMIRGEIAVQRGRLDLLGKRFILSEQSTLQFAGSQPPAPYVNIKADQTGPDNIFTINVTGVPPDVDVNLTSEPPLPEDEILSRMLFGRSLSGITPVQAARLAVAARELAGQGGGMDILGTAREVLRLDDLDVVSGSQGGNMSLRAGKYVNERVYLRLDSDLKTGEEEMSADVELTPRINLESTIGPKGGGLGLFWKYDY